MSSPEQQIASDYDASAVGYSRHWGPALNTLAAAFLDEVSLPQTGVIVDVGAGAGGLLPHLRERTTARLLAVDLSEGMLRLADPRHARVVSDAQRLAIRDGAVDAATAMFMLFHLPDPLRGLQELRRILRSGGVCAFTSWGAGDEEFAGFDAGDEVLDRHGAVAGRGFFERYEELETVAKCSDALTFAGFVDVEVGAKRMAHEFAVDDLIGFRTTVGSGRVRWKSVPEERLAAVRDELRKAVEQLSPGERTLRHEVIYAVGRVAR